MGSCARSVRRSRLAAVSACLLVACTDDPLSRLLPALEVEPASIDFGDACIGADNEAALVASNAGEGFLRFEGATVEPPDIFSLRALPDRLAPFRDVSLTVVFRPQVELQEYTGTLVLISDDPTRPRLTIALRGTGGARRVQVSPAAVDFGVVNEGAPAVRTVEIRNVGGAPLTLEGLTWTSTSVDLGPLGWPSPPLVLPPKTATVAHVTYDPVDLGRDQGTVVVETDDPESPRVEVPVTGLANLAPRAIAWSCPGRAEVGCGEDDRSRDRSAGLGARLRLDGRSAYDPEGGAVSGYAWRVLERPEGSRTAVFHGSDDLARDRATGEIEIDRVGRYTVRLTVRDERGLGSLDRPESRVVVRPKDLEVRVTWDLATDVDVHLVRPGGRLGDYGTGRVGTSTGSDASAFNRAPDWGTAGDAADDPRLDKDDVSGRGPEVVSLDFPEQAGPYRVYAHYCDSRDVAVPVNVTVEVRVRGESVATIPAADGVRLAPGEAWAAAEIQWAEPPTVVALSEPIVARPQLCRSE